MTRPLFLTDSSDLFKKYKNIELEGEYILCHNHLQHFKWNRERVLTKLKGGKEVKGSVPKPSENRYKKIGTGSSPVVRWLVLGFYCPGPGFQSLVGAEIFERERKPSDIARRKKKRKLEKSKAQKIETDTFSLLNTNLTVFPKSATGCSS